MDRFRSCLRELSKGTLIPGGDYESEFEKFLVVIISLVLLLVAARYSYRSGQLDFALDWFAE